MGSYVIFHFTRLTHFLANGTFKKLFAMSLPKTRIILERSSVKKACSTDTVVVVVVEWDFEIFNHFSSIEWSEMIEQNDIKCYQSERICMKKSVVYER